MPLVERQVTQLLRESGAVFSLAEREDLVLRRRDGADLLLVEFKRESGFREGASELAAIVSVLLREGSVNGAILAEAIVHALPWTRHFSSEDRLAFLEELAEESRASAELGSYDRIRIVMDSWKNTARLSMVPELWEAATSAIEEQEVDAVAEVGL